MAERQSLLPDDFSPRKFFSVTPPTLDEIIKATCSYYLLTFDELVLRTDRAASLARNLVSYQARTYGVASFDTIAKRLCRSRIAALTGDSKITGRLTVEERLRDDVDIIARHIADMVIERTQVEA